MLGSIERGLPLNEWDNMTVGMIFDYIITFNNAYLDEPDGQTEIRKATQADYDRW